jgi:hypothetical protein
MKSKMNYDTMATINRRNHMIKYRTGGWGKNRIEALEVEKETGNSVWIKVRSTKDAGLRMED